jgi:DNA-binding LytR/AlgR family response regulator
MEEITIVLLEDDPIDQIKVEMMLAESIAPQYKFNLAGIFTQLGTLLNYLSNHKVDLILSDILIQNKPVGIELLKKLRDTTTPVVLMTLSHDQALFVEAQSHRSVHYLIKPFHAISLQSTIQKALEEYCRSKQYDFVDKKYLFLSGKANKKEQVLFTDIVHIEAEDSHCYIYTLTKKYVLKKSLSKLLSEDLNAQFIRIHHKYAVNRAHVQKSETDIVQLTGQVVLPVGKSFKKEFNEFLKRHI